MKTQTILLNLTATAFCFILSGCATHIINLTPNKIPHNPSGIYTFSLTAKVPQVNVDPDSVEASIVINGERYAMKRSDRDKKIFIFDYKMPPSLNEVGYYYILEFDIHHNKILQHREYYSDLCNAQLINRYVIQLENYRAPVGSKVTVIGRGFSPYDVLLFDKHEISTEYASPNSLSFMVPSLPADRDYKVALRTDRGDIPIGKFRIDPASISVLLEESNIASEEKTMILFKIDFEAPPGGLYVNVTTDIPASIIMSEVVIPEGARSVNVPMEGSEPGEGKLFVEVPGFIPVEVPVTVY